MLWSELLILGEEKFKLTTQITTAFLQFLQAQGRVIFHRQKEPTAPAISPSPAPTSPALPVSYSSHQFDNIVILDASWFNKTVLAAVITSRHRFVKEGRITKQVCNF
jgi:hypothetical protein